MPAYSQPMMSAGQMTHDDAVANQQPVNGHVTTDTCRADEYIGSAETDFTGTEEYYSTTENTFVPVQDVPHSESPVDNCLSEETTADKQVIVQKCMFSFSILISRVTTCLGNLEMSGNLKHVRDVVNSQGIVTEMSWKKSCHGKLH